MQKCIQISNKHVKRCSTLYVIKELQLKQETIAHLLEWLKFQILTISGIGKNVEQQERLLIADGNAKYCSHISRQFDSFLQS